MIDSNIVLAIRIVEYNLRTFILDFVRMLDIISDWKTINLKFKLPDSQCCQT